MDFMSDWMLIQAARLAGLASTLDARIRRVVRPRDPDHPHPISIDLVNGAVECEDVEVDPVYFAQKTSLPFAVRDSVIRRVSARFSLKGLLTQQEPLVVRIEASRSCWRRATAVGRRGARRLPRGEAGGDLGRGVGVDRAAAARGGGRRGGRRGGGRPGGWGVRRCRASPSRRCRAVVEIAHVHVRASATAPAPTPVPTSARRAA